jgi:hypothetical protein
MSNPSDLAVANRLAPSIKSAILFEWIDIWSPTQRQNCFKFLIKFLVGYKLVGVFASFEF